MRNHYLNIGFLFITFLSAYTPLLQAQQFQNYTDTKKKFKISLPSDWTYFPDYKGTLFLAHRPMLKNTQSGVENVALSEIKDSSIKDLDQAFFNFKLAQKLSLTDYEETDQIKIDKQIKNRYYWVISRHPKPNTHDLIYNLSVIYKEKGKYYVLQCTTSAGNLDTYKPIFLKIADSIHFY
jgi:hypothetical protein